MKSSLYSVLIISFILVLSACNTENKSGKKPARVNDSTSAPVVKNLSIDSPLNGGSFPLGGKVLVKIKNSVPQIRLDSLQLFMNDKRVYAVDSNQLSYYWPSTGSQVGRNRLRVCSFKGGKLTESSSTTFILLSDVEPKTLHYKIINTFPHDAQAYTQGLVYEDGIFYESTGQYAQSSLRKVNVKTGEVRQSVNLASDIFGEGLASYGDKLIQITWKSQLAFVYDKQSFKQLNKFNYQGEGWGITYDGKRLIMSNGSENLTFYDTEFFTEQGHIEVYDNMEAISWLNELEYIKGEIYSNIYQESKIAVIDPASGKVKAYLDLNALVPEKLRKDNDHVLNGIAYNPANGHLYVTGKDWPVLYEISVY